MKSLNEHKLEIWINSKLSGFSFMLITFCILSKKTLPTPLCFLLEMSGFDSFSFYVQICYLTWNHFCICHEVGIKVAFPAPMYNCLNNFPSSVEMPWHLCQKSIEEEKSWGSIRKKISWQCKYGLHWLRFAGFDLYCYDFGMCVHEKYWCKYFSRNVFIKLWYQGFADLTASVVRCSFLSFSMGCVC